MERRNYVVISSSLVAMPLDQTNEEATWFDGLLRTALVVIFGSYIRWLGRTAGLQFWILRSDGGWIGHWWLLLWRSSGYTNISCISKMKNILQYNFFFFLCDSGMWCCGNMDCNLVIFRLQHVDPMSWTLNSQLSGPYLFTQGWFKGWSWVFKMPKLNIVIPYQFGGILNHYFHPQNWICSRSLWNSWIINIKLVQVLLGSMLFVHPSFPHPLLEFYIIQREVPERQHPPLLLYNVTRLTNQWSLHFTRNYDPPRLLSYGPMLK
jgi:hypothetical protein